MTTVYSSLSHVLRVPLAAEIHSRPFMRLEAPEVLSHLAGGGRVQQGGEIWTDFLIQSDGFSRFVVRDVDLREFQGGRLV